MRPGVWFLVAGSALSVTGVFLSATLSFVSPPQQPRRPQVLVLGAATADVQASPASPAKEPAAAAKDGKDGDKDIDDAVLQMAMAMAEEEAGNTPVTPAKKKDEGWKFDFQDVITLFLSALVIYSVGSSVISIATGRIQDRSGGDFTLYDFFDNIFSFKDWDIEYTLGFNPFKGGSS